VRSLFWGLRAGLFAATGVGLGPVIVVGVLAGGLQDFDDIGGVGRYLAWAYSSGILGGLTAGLLRPVASSGAALRLACGLVVAEVFALQPLIFDMGGAATSMRSAAMVMGGMAFVMGFAAGPLMIAGLKRTWPAQLVDPGTTTGEMEVDKSPVQEE
jgi:hypothetical protein